MRPFLPAALLFPLVLGCTGVDERPARIERTTIGDTVVVRNPDVGSRGTGTLREISRIGMAEGPDDQILADVHSFVEAPNGHVFIADDSGIREYAADGAFVRRIARPGGGPGETSYAPGMEVTPDGRLLAIDGQNVRVNVYDVASGESVATWPLPGTFGLMPRGRAAIVARGDDEILLGYGAPQPADGSDVVFPQPVYLRLNGSGELIDTIYAPARLTEECPERSSTWWRAGWFDDVRVHHFPKPKWSAAPEGLVIGCPAGYRFDVVRDGRVLRVELARAPARATAEERETFVTIQERERNRSGFFREGWSWRGPRPPEELPLYQRFVAGRDGHIWVWPQRERVAEEIPQEAQAQGLPARFWRDADGGAFDVFDADGEYLGPVALPDGVSYGPFPGSDDPFIRGDTVWLLTRDSLDVEYVVKYGVEWSR